MAVIFNFWHSFRFLLISRSTDINGRDETNTHAFSTIPSHDRILPTLQYNEPIRSFRCDVANLVLFHSTPFATRMWHVTISEGEIYNNLQFYLLRLTKKRDRFHTNMKNGLRLKSELVRCFS